MMVAQAFDFFSDPARLARVDRISVSGDAFEYLDTFAQAFHFIL